MEDIGSHLSCPFWFPLKMDSASWVQVVSLGDDLTKHSEEVEKETRKGIRAVKSVVTDGLSWWPTEVYLHWRPCWTHHREGIYLLITIPHWMRVLEG